MPYQGIYGVSITLNYDAVAQAERVFNALADGGKVAMALGPTFWVKRFGMVSDKLHGPLRTTNGNVLAIHRSDAGGKLVLQQHRSVQ